MDLLRCLTLTLIERSTLDPALRIQLREALARYAGHPYAVAAAISLVEAGLAPNELPPDPTGIGAKQYEMALRTAGPLAGKALKAHAIVDVWASPQLIATVMQVEDIDDLEAGYASTYLASLLPKDKDALPLVLRRIYHRILWEEAESRISPDERREMNRLAAIWYISLFEKNPNAPIPIAAARAPWHVLESNPDDFVRILLLIGSDLLSTMQYEELDRQLFTAAELVPENTVDAGRIKLLGAALAEARGTWALAKRIYEDACYMFESLGEIGLLADALERLGVACMKHGESAYGISCFERVFSLLTADGIDEMAVATRLNIATSIAKVGNPRGLELLQVCAAFAKGRDELGYALAVGNIGHVLIRHGEIWRVTDYAERAIANLEEALDIFRRTADLEHTSIQLANLAEAYWVNGDIAKAEELINEAIELNTKGSRTFGLAANHLLRARIGYSAGRLQDAFDDLAAGRLHFERLGVEEHLRGIDELVLEWGGRPQVDDTAYQEPPSSR